jgi:hypothetical protein
MDPTQLLPEMRDKGKVEKKKRKRGDSSSSSSDSGVVSSCTFQP